MELGIIRDETWNGREMTMRQRDRFKSYFFNTIRNEIVTIACEHRCAQNCSIHSTINKFQYTKVLVLRLLFFVE